MGDKGPTLYSGSVPDSVASIDERTDDGSHYYEDLRTDVSWEDADLYWIERWSWWPEVRGWVLQPMIMGAAVAFGMSLGYSLFDIATKAVRRRS
mmetsp:Transcript_18041/g.37447  ORF Transcript_18041/g.37447 Transcript_18041/m.37447 type:complete len:94 (-) Transcript_18041:604-885(-)